MSENKILWQGQAELDTYHELPCSDFHCLDYKGRGASIFDVRLTYMDNRLQCEFADKYETPDKFSPSVKQWHSLSGQNFQSILEAVVKEVLNLSETTINADGVTQGSELKIFSFQGIRDEPKNSAPFGSLEVNRNFRAGNFDEACKTAKELLSQAVRESYENETDKLSQWRLTAVREVIQPEIMKPQFEPRFTALFFDLKG